MSKRPHKIAGPTAVLLIAHGSRRQAANDDLLRLADIIRQKQVFDVVEVGYLDVTEPSIPQGARTCVECGAVQVLMLPYFLSAGEHAISDLRRYRCELSDEFPNVSFTLCPPLGLHPLLVDVVLDRLKRQDE